MSRPNCGKISLLLLFCDVFRDEAYAVKKGILLGLVCFYVIKLQLLENRQMGPI